VKIKSKILFHMSPEKTKSMLDLLGIEAKVETKDTLQAISLFTDTEQYINLIQKLNELSVDYSESKEKVYSKRDLDSAQLFRMIANVYCGYPQPEEYEKVSYDLKTGCPDCSNGMIQNAPLRILKPKIWLNDVYGVHWIYEYVTTEKFRELIEREQFTGFEFWPIINHRTNKKHDDIFQLFITGTMPPMNPEAIIESGIEPCKCGKRGYTLKDIPIYMNDSIKEIKDFNKSIEWLGGMLGSWQIPIVSKQVYRFFVKNKIRGLRFEPVKVID
jgi:hypothetical protein